MGDGREPPSWRPASGDPSWERLRQAVIDAVLENGYDEMDIEEVLGRAEYPPDEFKRHFGDKKQCCLRVYEANIADFDSLVFGAYERHETWRDGLRASAYAAAAYLAEHPREVVFGELEMRAGGEMAQALRDSYLRRIVDLVDAGRQELDDPDRLGRSVAEGVCGAVYQLMLRELQAGTGTRSAQDLVPQLMYIAVRPYLGHDVAREELELPTPHRGAARG